MLEEERNKNNPLSNWIVRIHFQLAIFIFLVHVEPNPVLCKHVVSGWAHNSLLQGSFCIFSESQTEKGVALDM